MTTDITNSSTGPDYGAIENGSFQEISNTLWLLMALVNQEVQSRQQADEQLSPSPRQDRLIMMGLYAA